MEVATWHTGKFKEVKFQSAGNNGYLITFKYFAGDGFACINSIAEMVGSGKRDINKPDTTPRFVPFKIRII